MKKLFIAAAVCLAIIACNDTKTDSASTGTTGDSESTKTTAPAEFADARYMELGKTMTAQFASGDMDAWMGHFTDNSVFRWSSGDSLAGKEAIAKYWKDRRMNVIDSISFTNDIWIPLKVNTPQKGPDRPGIWLLNWYQVNVKYKNGKKLQFWVHTDHHFDAGDKIDETIQYIDMAPIKSALTSK